MDRSRQSIVLSEKLPLGNIQNLFNGVIGFKEQDTSVQDRF